MARTAYGGSTPLSSVLTAPPCTRRRVPRDSRSSRSRRMVISDVLVERASSATEARLRSASRARMNRWRSETFMSLM
ncbi:hypothetical protein SRIMM317S_02982 [Streptomyces rimosus subsp. rimosus]